MADLLVTMPNITHEPSDPGSWLPGMVVDVYPSGQLGPGTDQHPRFFIVRLPKVSVEDARALTEELWTDAEGTLKKRRVYQIDFTKVGDVRTNQVAFERDIEFTTVSEFLAYLKVLT